MNAIKPTKKVSLEFIQKIQQLDVQCLHAIEGDSHPNSAQVPIDSWSMTHRHIDSASTCRHEHHEQIWFLYGFDSKRCGLIYSDHIRGIQRLYDRVGLQLHPGHGDPTGVEYEILWFGLELANVFCYQRAQS
jgi:hypothetical protein